jgi:hypothetical protein
MSHKCLIVFRLGKHGDHTLWQNSRMLLEPILDNLGLMTRCIVLLEYPITVGIHEVHEGLALVSKQCKVAVTGQRHV